MKTLEIKHIAPYLACNLKAVDQYGNIRTVVLNHQTYDTKTVGVNHLLEVEKVFINPHKPILISLSRLTQEIEVNGEKFVPVQWFEIGDDDSGIEYDHGNIKLIKTLKSIARHNNFHDVEFLPFSVVQKLIEWEFDIFGLIPNGLAVPY